MGKPSRFLLAIAIIIVGTAVAANHPEWGTLTSVSVLLLLLAGVIGAGVLAVRTRSADAGVKRKSGAMKASNSLITLSSAAILAVYAAGYHRTGSAEDKYAGQSARRRVTAPLPASVIAPAAVTSNVEAPRTVQPSPVAPLSADRPRTSAAVVPKPSSLPAAEVSNAAPVAPAPLVNTPATPAAPPVAVATTETAPASPAPPVVPSREASTAQPAVAPPAAKPPRQYKYKEGTFLGWGYSRHGDIQASVVIKAGQIISAEIERCQTRYPCSWIMDLPGQAVTRQSSDVDVISGASESSYAYSDAVMDALSKASE
jgi:uncharacterized protein with FMN-binding domain